MKSFTLERILAATCGSEDDEESMELLRQMLNPTTKEEMAKVYEEVVGYNPINYFDRCEAAKYFDIMVSDAPTGIKENLIDCKEEILDNVIQHKENLNSDYLITLLNLEMEHTAGWRNKKYPTLTFDEESTDLEDDFDDDEDDDFDDYDNEDDFNDDEKDE